MTSRLSAKTSLSQTLSVRKTALKLLFEISRIRIVYFKILTQMESARNCKDSDIKYVYVLAPKSRLKLFENSFFSCFWADLFNYENCFALQWFLFQSTSSVLIEYWIPFICCKEYHFVFANFRKKISFESRIPRKVRLGKVRLTSPCSSSLCTFHDGCKQGIDQQVFNRKSISRKITHPKSWKLQAKLTGEKLKGWSNSREKQTQDCNQNFVTQAQNHNILTNWLTSKILVATKKLTHEISVYSKNTFTQINKWLKHLTTN